jgi:hypothetical protein
MQHLPVAKDFVFYVILKFISGRPRCGLGLIQFPPPVKKLRNPTLRQTNLGSDFALRYTGVFESFNLMIPQGFGSRHCCRSARKGRCALLRVFFWCGHKALFDKFRQDDTQRSISSTNRLPGARLCDERPENYENAHKTRVGTRTRDPKARRRQAEPLW